METIRGMISAVNKRRKRIWKAVKKNCKLSRFNFCRRNRSPNSTFENAVDVYDVELLDEQPTDEETMVRNSEADTQISVLAIAATNEENEPTVGDFEKEQPWCDRRQSEKNKIKRVKRRKSVMLEDTIQILPGEKIDEFEDGDQTKGSLDPSKCDSLEIPEDNAALIFKETQITTTKDPKFLSDSGQQSSENFSVTANWFKQSPYLSQSLIRHFDYDENEQNDDNGNIFNSFITPYMSMDDFKPIDMLGRGSFGKVMLCRHNKSNKYFAVKELNKNYLIESNEIGSVFIEKRIFQLANDARHPFLTNLFACFQTDDDLCFVMEYAAGGDLLRHILRGEFTESRSVFYAACVVLGLKFLHENSIVHRDLKLANILIYADGYVKIADYGLCKERIGYEDRIRERCGTPTYMAPEILTDSPYSRGVDWWALGVIIFEMLVGDLPFSGANPKELDESIVNHNVKYPEYLSMEAFAIIRRLLCKNPDKRLGSSRRNAEEVQEQAFFRGIVWDDLIEKKVEPPWVPRVKSYT